MEAPGVAPRSQLFEAAVEALQCELASRLAQLHARKGDIGRLAGLADYLRAHGWNARADVSTHQHAGVTLRLWVTVASTEQLSALLRDVTSDGIEAARNEQYCGDTVEYHLLLSDRMRVVMRVCVASRPAVRVAA